MDLLTHFFVAMFCINAIPHLINGLSGRPFPSPFASLPGKGESPAPLNIVWACFNFAIAGFLITQDLEFFELTTGKTIALIAGAVSTAFMLSWWFGQIYGGKHNKTETP